MHQTVSASDGTVLGGHRDSSSHLRVEHNGRRAMPDFTLVTTHVGAIEVGGQVVGLARFATVNWRYTCRFGRVKPGPTSPNQRASLIPKLSLIPRPTDPESE